MGLELLFKAEAIIEEAFKDKVDKQGEPYIEHLIGVASWFDEREDRDYEIVALLHDLLEDCPEWTEERLYKEGFTKNIVEAIVLLTKVKGEDYEDYLSRVAQNKIAIEVKLADLRHNMLLTRYKQELTNKDIERCLKYHKAYLYLKSKL